MTLTQNKWYKIYENVNTKDSYSPRSEKYITLVTQWPRFARHKLQGTNSLTVSPGLMVMREDSRWKVSTGYYLDIFTLIFCKRLYGFVGTERS